MINDFSCTKYKPLLFSSPINPSTHLPINFFSSLGRYCFIAAGAVVTKDVPDYAFIVGIPGKQKNWMSRHGHILKPDKNGLMVCPESSLHYQEISPVILKCLDLDEEEQLPEKLAKGSEYYRTFKAKNVK